MIHAPITATDIESAKPVSLAEACRACRTAAPLGIAITMAFQPIVDLHTGDIFAYEALVRGVDGRSAGEVLAGVGPDMIYKFDQACRVKAIELAGHLFRPDDGAKLSINFMPNAVYEPDACIRASLAAARRVAFDPTRLMFEFTENEEMVDTSHVAGIIDTYQRMGFTTALDDFGAGHAGLSLLAKFQTDVIKLDMELVRGIDASLPRRMIVEGLLAMFARMDIAAVAEGVETQAEYDVLRAMGVRYMQGYLLAAPGFRTLPRHVLPQQEPIARHA